jgi:signal transduction histidine kinase
VFARSRRGLETAADKNVLVRASRGTVGQVLDVLLDNALHHGGGAARITVAADGRAARITVADEGPGVAPGDRDRIFERGASRAGGTGIGLHLARALAQADHGSLRVLDGAPTRFELRLPRLTE